MPISSKITARYNVKNKDNDKIDDLTNQTKYLIRSISLYQKSVWLLLIMGMITFSLYLKLYYDTREIIFPQTTENETPEKRSDKCNFKIDFSSKQDANKYSFTGFSRIEEFGRWSKAKSAKIKFILPEAVCNYSIATFRLIAFFPKKVPYQSANITINNTSFGEIRIKKEHPLREFNFGITHNLLKQGATNVIEFEIKYPSSPKSQGINTDGRLLGIGLKSIIFKNFYQ